MIDPAAVLEILSPAAVSRQLSEAGYQRDETIGRQSRPFEPLGRSGGFRVKQNLGWTVEVWLRDSDEQSRASTYAQITNTLTERGYRVRPNGQPGRAAGLTVERGRLLNAGEWAALEHLARSPLILPAAQVREVQRTGTPDGAISAEAFSALARSDLIEASGPHRVLRDPDTGTHADHVRLVSLTADGMALLLARNQARVSRAMWRLIAPGNREDEPPPFLAGDPAADRVRATTT